MFLMLKSLRTVRHQKLSLILGIPQTQGSLCIPLPPSDQRSRRGSNINLVWIFDPTREDDTEYVQPSDHQR
jgi:hypothetical protein